MSHFGRLAPAQPTLRPTTSILEKLTINVLQNCLRKLWTYEKPPVHVRRAAGTPGARHSCSRSLSRLRTSQFAAPACLTRTACTRPNHRLKTANELAASHEALYVFLGRPQALTPKLPERKPQPYYVRKGENAWTLVVRRLFEHFS